MLQAAKHPEYRQAVDEFLALGLRPGEFVTHEWLDKNLGIDPRKIVDEDTAKSVALERLTKVSAFRNELLEEHSIYVESVRGKGYEVVAAGQQSERAKKQFLTDLRSSAIRFEKALRYVDVAALTDSERKENTDLRVKIAGLRIDARRIFRATPALTSPTKSETPRR